MGQIIQNGAEKISESRDIRGVAIERLQFYLDTEMSRKLAAAAERLHVSKAEVIRRGIRLLLQETQAVEDDPLFDMVGIGAGGPGQVSVEHDRYLADAKLRRRCK